MTSSSVAALLVVAVVAVVSPLIAELSGPLKVPAVVIELGLGIVVGPHALALARPDNLINGLSEMGLAFLMFLAGYELDVARVRGKPLRLAVEGWLLSLVLALGVGFALVSAGLAIDALVVGLTLTTTALGTLLPVLRDADVVKTPFGALIMGVGTVGEFGPIVAVAVLLDHRDPRRTTALLLLFVVVAVAAALVATRQQPVWFRRLLERHLHSSSQLPIRVAVLLVVGLVYLAFHLGLDVLLGAFSAGIVVRLLVVGPDSEVVSEKLEAIGFGLLIPIFFVASGMGFDTSALGARPSAFARVPLFLVLFLLIRGIPALVLYRRRIPALQVRALALLSSTGLPLIVVITTIGTSEGRMIPENAAALVAAGMLSVLIYPLLALRLLVKASPDSPPPAADAAPPTPHEQPRSAGWRPEP